MKVYSHFVCTPNTHNYYKLSIDNFTFLYSNQNNVNHSSNLEKILTQENILKVREKILKND